MERVAFILLGLLLSAGLFAQDRIVRYQGDTITCTVVEMNDDVVKYRYPREELLNTESLVNISQILLASGRVINGKPRVEVVDEHDWMKVMIAQSYDEVKGLELVAEVRESNSSAAFGSYASINSLRAEAIENLKRKAAAHQCHVIYITSDNSRAGVTGTKAWPQANLTANIYRYPGQRYTSRQDRFAVAVMTGSISSLRGHWDYARDYYQATVKMIKASESMEHIETCRCRTVLLETYQNSPETSGYARFDLERLKRMTEKKINKIQK